MSVAVVVAEFDACDVRLGADWRRHRGGCPTRVGCRGGRRSITSASPFFGGVSALAGSMSAGRMSYSHVRAISRVAHPGEDQLVGDLIMVADHGVNDSETPLRELRGDERAGVVIHLDAADVPAEDGPVRSRERTGPTRSAERTRRPYARIADGPGLPDRVINGCCVPAGSALSSTKTAMCGTSADLIGW